MSKSYPINCVTTKKRLAEIGFDDHGKPIVRLWCKACRIEHICSMASMLQSWRGMLAGDQVTMVNYLGILKKAVLEIEADLEDCAIVEKKEEVS